MDTALERGQVAYTDDTPMVIDLVRTWELRLRNLRLGNLRSRPRKPRVRK